jgi:hypothetical protein
MALMILTKQEEEDCSELEIQMELVEESYPAVEIRMTQKERDCPDLPREIQTEPRERGHIIPEM